MHYLDAEVLTIIRIYGPVSCRDVTKRRTQLPTGTNEFYHQRLETRRAIDRLVLDGLVDTSDEAGWMFDVTDRGRVACSYMWRGGNILVRLSGACS